MYVLISLLPQKTIAESLLSSPIAHYLNAGGDE